MDWKQGMKNRPYSAAAAVFGFVAAGLMFASIPTQSEQLRLTAGGFIAAAIVAGFLALFGAGGLYRR